MKTIFICYDIAMRIGIEASRANRAEKTGVEWYAYHLIQELKKMPSAMDHSWLLYGNTPLARGLEKGPVNWHEVLLSWPPTYLWTQLCLTLEMKRHAPDVLFVPAHVLPRIIPKHSVVTVHDVGFSRLPHLYPGFNKLPSIPTSTPRRFFEWSTKDIVKRASKILTVSEFSKRELVEIYKADPAKVFVTYLGLDHDRYTRASSTEVQATLSRLCISAPYLAYVGRIEAKKNVGLLVQAFTRYKEQRGASDPLQLVLIGMPGMGADEVMRLIEASSVRDAIHVTGYVSEQDKIALLSGAKAMVHPAWYEGFGLTPLEAMACGCPVICSNAGSLPEVVGEENALWFDPSNVEELVECLTQFMNDDAYGHMLRERGLVWCKKYTWAETARQTLDHLVSWE